VIQSTPALSDVPVDSRRVLAVSDWYTPGEFLCSPGAEEAAACRELSTADDRHLGQKWLRDDSGHARAVAPTSVTDVTNSRRFTRSPRQHGRAASAGW
jgi:hypothetical protein